MKYSIQHIIYALATAIFLAGCETEFDNPVGDTSSYSNGDVGFSKFVALGDSLTAGYADGALYLMGQENSFPSILAQQFALVGGGEFIQPLVDDNAGGLLLGGTQITDNRLVLSGTSGDDLSPVTVSDTPTTEVLSALTGSFNNMGVPGAKSFHALSEGYGFRDAATIAGGLANPYFARFASGDSTTASMIGDAAGQAPSFFVLWLGNNDILSYATGGGTGTDQTGNFDALTYGPEDITDPIAVFPGTYSGLIASMTVAGGKGVLVNIPNVSSIPYFTTVPYNAIPLDAATADELNAGFAAYNGGVNAALGLSLIDAAEAAQRQINFVEGVNPVLILDDDLSDITAVDPALINMRQATVNDLILLPTSSTIGVSSGGLYGVSVPLVDADVLTENEAALVETARMAYNATIQATADASDDLVLYDAATMLDELNTSGLNYGTGSIFSTYATGGGFSLDGVHPTARGYAVIANGIIDTINEGFGANIPHVDPSAYTTVFIQ